MSGTMTFTRTDGSTYNAFVKWRPEEVERMNRQQLVEMLTEILAFAKYMEETFYNPTASLEAECRELSKNKESADSFGMISKIGLLVVLVLSVICFFSNGILAALYLAFSPVLILVALVLAIICHIRKSKANKKYNERYSVAENEIDRLKQQKTHELSGSLYDIHISAFSVLPNYYLWPAALQFMIEALQNFRATTLGEAVNLWEQAKALQAGLAAQYAAAAAANAAAAQAARTAAAAESAATSAGIAATNSIYGRK